MLITIRRIRILNVLMLCISLGVLLISCGSRNGGNDVGTSSNQSSSGAKLSITINWPTSPLGPLNGTARSLIPATTTQIYVTVCTGYLSACPNSIHQQLGPTVAFITWQNPTAYFENLPPGMLTVTASAYSVETGAETAALATGTGYVTMQSGVTSTLAITMKSTIDHIIISPTPGGFTRGRCFYEFNRLIEGPTELTAAYDATGALVGIGLLGHWQSSDPTIACFKCTLLQSASYCDGLAANALGNTTITFTELDTGVTASAIISVVQ